MDFLNVECRTLNIEYRTETPIDVRYSLFGVRYLIGFLNIEQSLTSTNSRGNTDF